MKRVALLLCVGILAATPALGQFHAWLSVDVPFDFYIGETAVTRGNYLIYHSVFSNTMFQIVRTDDPTVSRFVMAMIRPDRAGSGEDSKLIFLRYDNDHTFLKSFERGDAINVALHMSRTEREHVTSRVVNNVTASAEPKTVVVIARTM